MVTLSVNDDLILKSYQRGDEKALYDAVDGSRAHLEAWLPWVRGTNSPADSLDFIEHCIHQADSQSELVLGIRTGGRIIGSIGMHQWDHGTKRAQLGYWISLEYEGRGIVKQCLSRFIDFLFQNAGLNKLEIHFTAANKRSARVAESLGFKVEGVIRQAHLRNGLTEDLVMTGLLKTEWKG